MITDVAFDLAKVDSDFQRVFVSYIQVQPLCFFVGLNSSGKQLSPITLDRYRHVACVTILNPDPRLKAREIPIQAVADGRL